MGINSIPSLSLGGHELSREEISTLIALIDWRKTAIHEAGHAMACFLGGFHWREVSIGWADENGEEMDDGAPGRITGTPWPDFSIRGSRRLLRKSKMERDWRRETRRKHPPGPLCPKAFLRRMSDEWRAYLVKTLGGPIAEAIYLHENDRSWRSWDFLEPAAQADDDDDLYVDEPASGDDQAVVDHCRMLFPESQNRHKTQARVRILKRRCRYVQRVQSQLRREFEKAHNWRAIEALANALLEKKRLEYEEAKAVIVSAVRDNPRP